jgi:hypothetical protein
LEEEGGVIPNSSDGDSNEHNNWDQPLIIAEPDVQVFMKLDRIIIFSLTL